MALAGSLAKVASTLISKFGADVTVRFVTAGAYNTSTGTVTETTSDTTVKGLIEGVTSTEVDELIKRTDKRLTVAANDLATVPAPKDRVVISSVEYQIVTINTQEQEGSPITYELFLRA
tara:strand:+ start:237 stop:593 length:357 start_codon:yes stop_codon:yes gene_type:complete